MEYNDALDNVEYNIIGTFECMDSEYAPTIINILFDKNLLNSTSYKIFLAFFFKNGNI